MDSVQPSISANACMHADVLDALTGALAEHASLAAPICSALQKLVMGRTQREHCVNTVLNHLSSVPADVVPDLAFFALQQCSPGKHAVSVCKVWVLRVHTSTQITSSMRRQVLAAVTINPTQVVTG